MPLFSRVRRDAEQRRESATAALDPLAQCFDRQLAVIADPSKFKALLCGRRAGKTDAILRDFAAGMLNEPGSLNLFVALTITSAREILWEPMKRQNHLHGWGFDFDDGKMIVTHGNGSRLLVRGSENKRDLEKPRGQNFRRIRLDECGAQRPDYLRYLVEEVLEPSLMDDPDSDCWLAGTCTTQAFGFFYDLTTGARPGYSLHSWTAANNPFVDYQGFVYGRPGKPGLLERRGWTEGHPIFRREYLAEWVFDGEACIYRFDPLRNVVQALPELAPGDTWARVLSLDFGVGHHTAAAVLAWPRKYGRDVYAEHTWQARGLAPSDAATRIHKTYTDYRADYIIGDLSGLGKAYQVEWNKHYPHVAMKGADKQAKRAAMEITSDALHVAVSAGDYTQRRGLMSLAANTELHRQWATLQWNEDRTDVADGQDDDVSHAVLYGYRETPAFANPTELPAQWVNPAAGTALEGWHRPPPKTQHPGLKGAFGIGSLRRRR